MTIRRNALLATMIPALLAAAAAAQTAAGRWFFSLDGLSDPSDPQCPAVAPANLPPRVNPDGGLLGNRLYLWFNNPVSSRVWTGFQNYVIDIRDGDAVITDVALYNLNMVVDLGDDGAPGGGDDITATRWSAVNEGVGERTPVVSGISMLSLSGTMGIRNGSLPIGGDPHFRGAAENRATLVGHIDVSPGSGRVFIRHGLTAASATTGAVIPPPDAFIRLGFGDEDTVYTGGASGDSPIPEATLTPEPGTLMLLGAASLVSLRRRP
ncbi:hypothetical protein RAS1_40080 [Phycisphaerae bacterium RAS1]|nr:hypothetical protein RAS1_40080 [Phycisphaerae bacterium RAS1]